MIAEVLGGPLDYVVLLAYFVGIMVFGLWFGQHRPVGKEGTGGLDVQEPVVLVQILRRACAPVERERATVADGQQLPQQDRLNHQVH